MARTSKKREETKLKAEQMAEEHVNGDLAEASKVDADSFSSQCGGVLSAARAEQGLTTKDIAKQLRLSVTQIEALEEDRFSALPESTIVKGFIRNYAKLLKVPAEPILAAYMEMKPEEEVYSFALDPGINMKITGDDKSNKPRYFIFAVALLLGAAIWFFYQNYVQKPNPINPLPEETLPELASSVPEEGEHATIQPLNMPEQAVIPADDVAGEKVEAQSDEMPIEKAIELEASSEEKETNVGATLAEEDAIPVNTKPTPGKTRLAFSATQETWLSVVNIEGKEVYNKILYAGNHDVIDVKSPQEVVVGNAHGTTLIINGKPIDLAPYTRINVARVRVDRISR